MEHTHTITGKDIYRAVMGGIEPDLLHPRVDDLAAIYAGETPEQHAARMKRYDEAFQQYDARIAELKSRVHDEERDVRRQAEEASLAQDKEAEEGLLTQIASL